MNFTKTILEGIKHWVEKKFAKIESDLANKQPVGDYALKEDIPEIPVTSVNGMTGDVVVDIPEGAIKPFPYYAVESNGTLIKYKVNLEELETGTLYSMQENSGIQRAYFALYIICDDGTEEAVKSIFNKTSVYYISKTPKNIALYSAFENDYWYINISDKSTASNITVTSNLISRWLPVNNSIEYIPTDNYHPATKKYVDDSVANSVPVPAIATVGQTVIVKSVDENEKPTEWEVKDIPEQVQSDWAQTDETATNYIKNKPSLATSEEIKALFN